MTAETTVQIPLNLVQDSPFNPRQTYNEAKLQQLADTIVEVGVQQPIVVRDLPNGAYQIIFGHRRCRAARIAGLDLIPAFVRNMTNEEVERVQLIENIQREDVDAVEEAIAINRLVKSKMIKPDDLAKKLGVGRTYIYDSIKLATASDVLHKAMRGVPLQREVATLIARVPASLQSTAIKACMTKQWDDALEKQIDACRSYRECKSIIARGFTVSLNEARFNITSAPSCAMCPKRSDNAQPLLDDLGPDVCTDKPCFDQKTVDHAKSLIAKAREQGREVIEGAAAAELLPSQWSSWVTGHERLDSVAGSEIDGDGKRINVTYQDLLDRMGDSAPKAKLIVSPHTPGRLIEVLDDDVANQVRATLVGADEEDGGGDDAPARAPAPEVIAVRDHWPLVKTAMLAAVRSRARTTDDMRLVIYTMLEFNDEVPSFVREAFGWNEDDFEDDWADMLRARIEVMSANDLAVFMLALAIDAGPPDILIHRDDDNAWHVRRVQFADSFGVDVCKAAGIDREPAEPNPPPRPAARAKYKATGKAKKTPTAASAADDDAVVDDKTLPLPIEGGSMHNDDTVVRAKPLEPVAAWPFPNKKKKDEAPSAQSQAHDAAAPQDRAEAT